MRQNGLCISYLLRFNRIRAFLLANGWREAATPGEAEVVVLGACASWLSSYEDFRRDVLGLRSNATPPRLVVYGCLPKVDPAFYRALNLTDTVTIPIREPQRIERVVDTLIRPWDEVDEPVEFRREDYSHYEPERVFVMIQEGCSEGCTFCPHTLGIGTETSLPLATILDRIQAGVAAGGRTVYIEGNNAGSWGLDITPRQTFSDLMTAIRDMPEPFTIQLGNFAPKWAVLHGDILRSPRIGEAKIPIQTTSARLLTLVGRDPHVADLAETLRRARRDNPDLILRTEVIAGLPTETEAEFDDTLDFVAEHFDKVAFYSFDPHPATPIMGMRDSFVDAATVERRLRRARARFADHTRVQAAFGFGAVCENMKSDRHHDQMHAIHTIEESVR